MVIKLLIKLQNSEKICHRIIQKQSQMSIINKYLKKYIYLQDKDRILLMIWDQYNSIIIEYQKIINLIYNKSNQPTKLRKKNWVEIND